MKAPRVEAGAMRRGERRRILVEPNAHHLLNMGDVAMLQVAVERLESLWPEASIEVITDSPERLARHCPRALPVSAVGRRQWFRDRYLSETLHRALPARLSGDLLDAERFVRRRVSRLAEAAIRLTGAMRREPSAPLGLFLDAVRDADLVVVSGAGALNDDFAPLAMTVLDLLEMAKGHGATTALLGQGLGPVESPVLLARARAVLPHVDLISLREGRAGAPLLAAWGVPADRVLVTGDDAVELAYRSRHDRPPGRALGVGLRAARYSALDTQAIARIGETLTQVAERRGATLTPVPISWVPGEADAPAIAAMLGGGTGPDDHDALDTPAAVCERIGECRVVVTGSYHAALFALAQGVQAVALARSHYYFDKFAGLGEQFDGRLRVIALDDSEWDGRLASAVDAAWAEADDVHEPLLIAAARQVDLSRAAYARLHAIACTKGAGTAGARHRPPRLTHLHRAGGRRRFNLDQQESPTWNERAEAAVELLARNEQGLALAAPLRIADLGCGNERLRSVLHGSLPTPHRYQGYDLRPQTTTSLPLDVERELPAGDFDVVFCLGLVEYLRDLPWFLRRLASRFRVVILSYAIADSPIPLSRRQRRSRQWRTHNTRKDMEEELARCGFDRRDSALVNDGRTALWLAVSAIADDPSGSVDT